MNETRKSACEPFEGLLVLYACDELEGSERARVDEHIEQCAACAAALVREMRLRQALGSLGQAADRLDPSGLLLAQCRSELAEQLDDAAGPAARRRWLGWLRPSDWFVLRPAWTAALLVLIGVSLGTVAPRWFTQEPGPINGAGFVVSAPKLTDQDMQTLGVSGINWVGDSSSGTPGIELQLTAEKPLIVQGTPDSADVRRVLTFVVENGQRFDPGVRLDSVDVLRMRPSDALVRQALCNAVRGDGNPGVRLKALEALRGFEQDELVRDTLLSALVEDNNPGVRIEAINALRTLAEKSPEFDDQRVIEVLRERMQNDPNTYIRMQSAAVVRQLGPRQSY